MQCMTTLHISDYSRNVSTRPDHHARRLVAITGNVCVPESVRVRPRAGVVLLCRPCKFLPLSCPFRSRPIFHPPVFFLSPPPQYSTLRPFVTTASSHRLTSLSPSRRTAHLAARPRIEQPAPAASLSSSRPSHSSPLFSPVTLLLISSPPSIALIVSLPAISSAGTIGALG